MGGIIGLVFSSWWHVGPKHLAARSCFYGNSHLNKSHLRSHNGLSTYLAIAKGFFLSSPLLKAMATRKKRKTKGCAATEECVHVNKKSNKPVKHYTSLRDKILAADLYITQKKSASETKAKLKEQGTDLPENTIKSVANKTQKQAKIHGHALQDITNFQGAPKSGCSKASEPDQADALARYVTSSRITQMKTGQEHINHLNLCIRGFHVARKCFQKAQEPQIIRTFGLFATNSWWQKVRKFENPQIPKPQNPGLRGSVNSK